MFLVLGNEIRKRLRRKKKVALVCAGGGVTGAVYEIGCLRALEDLIDRSVCDFDIYVGVSGGAFVASLLAAGVSAGEMYEQAAERGRRPFGTSTADIYRIGIRDVLRRSARAPKVLADALVTAFTGEGRNLSDLALALFELLPAGLLDNSGIREYIAAVLRARGIQDSFRALERELYIVAVDLDTGEAVPFGAHGSPTVPISQAVQASTALPGLYRPVRIGGRDYVDGGVKKTAHIHLAIDHGADLVICINPIVPFENNTYRSPLGGHLANKGVTYVLDQVLRIMLHSRMQYGIERYALEHPGVDILLLEPRRNDMRMFSYNIMRYSARRVVAAHGYLSVKEAFATNHRSYKKTLARCGIKVAPAESLPSTPDELLFHSPVARSLAGSLDALSAKLA